MGESEQLRWDPPRPSSVAWITPTLLNSASKCPARAGFEKDPRTASLRRSGLRAALGSVAHLAWERRAVGVDFESAWAKATEETSTRIAKEWSPAIPPTPSNWPGWALTKTRMRNAWANDSSSRPVPSKDRYTAGDKLSGSQAAWESGWAPPVGPLPWRERWLHDPLRHLAGKPDLVERLDGQLRVVDLKSGKQQGPPTQSQADQLLLYAALVESVLSELPTVGEIRDADGRRYPMDIERGAVESVVARAEDTWAMLDLAGASGGSALDARPDPDVCGTCPFRLVCLPFLESVDDTWICGHTAVGRVIDVLTIGTHTAVDVDVIAPDWRRQHMRLIAFPFPASPSPGEIWGFSDFDGPGQTGMARWNTLVAPWPSVTNEG
jgi:hypothetical protein